MLYDVFICHASEDKESFVRPLADALRSKHLAVWYDEFALTLGDSIRRAVDRGLRQSRYGVVVLSAHFLAKNWPQYELDGLIERELTAGEKVILPIWHGIEHDAVAKYSPALAGKMAISTDAGLAAVVERIVEVLRPDGSPLLIAQDMLAARGVDTPVITDRYWLQVVEASNRIPATGAVPPPDSCWGRWSFPLPENEDGDAEEWGERLCWTALQMNWTSRAEDVPITVVTPPDVALDFIQTSPGLLEICELIPDLAAEYAPQLTIPGFGGPLERAFTEAYERSVKPREGLSGTALTTDGRAPACDDAWCLRHPDFGFYRPAHVAYAYFHGGVFGPDVSCFDDADHFIWLVSAQSSWLPQRIRDTLVDGLARCWNSWSWMGRGDQEWASVGAAYDSLKRGFRSGSYQWSDKVVDDWLHRIELAASRLQLLEPLDVLLARVRDSALVERAIDEERVERPKGRKRK